MKRKVLELLKEKPEDMAGVVEVGEQFYREVEIDDGAELKTALQKEREDRKALESKLNGIDLEEYKKLMAQKQDSLTETEKLESAVKKLRAEIDGMKESHAAEVTDLNGKLRRHHLDEKSRAAALKAGVLPDHVDDVLTLTASRRSLDKDGKIIIVDKDGDPTGTSLKDFFGKELKESKPLFYMGIPGGGGGRGGPGGPEGLTTTRATFESWSPQKCQDFVQKGGTVT